MRPRAILTGLSHRLRGHRLRHLTKSWSGVRSGIEMGYSYQVLSCSCGQSWNWTTDPLNPDDGWWF